MKSSAAFLAVIAFVLGLWGMAQLNDDSDPGDGTREREVAVAVDATVDPLALPLHLPVELPAGHAWVGETQRDRVEGETVAVTTAFQSGDGAVVALCAAAATEVDACRPEVEADGADGGTGEIERTVGEYVVLVRPVRGSFGSATEAAFWETVELTADPTRVPWLPASARP